MISIDKYQKLPIMNLLALRWTGVIVLLIASPSAITPASSQALESNESISSVTELTADNFQDVIDKHLLVFVMFYRRYDDVCTGFGRPGVEEFVVGARVAKTNGMTAYLDLKFGRVNNQNQTALASKYKIGEMNCYSTPKILLFRYGRVIRYEGLRVFDSAWNKSMEHVLSKDQLTAKGMFEFLENNTKLSASIIQTKNELQKFVVGSESAITLYFKEGSKAKVIFWNLADRRKDHIWGAVMNQSMNNYSVDTIVIHINFGASSEILDKNLTTESIENFVDLHSNPSGPILELTDKNFQDTVDTNLLVFVIFHNPACGVPEFFEAGARIAVENGMAQFLNMKFGILNIKKGSRTFDKYRSSLGSLSSECEDQWQQIILFRYGKVIQYSVSGSNVRWPYQAPFVKGMFGWLEKNTKPSVKVIQSDYQLRTFVDYTEVTIVGYFKENSKGKLAFWKLADNLTDYKWATVTNPYLNLFEVDTIIINHEYGVGRMMINENLTEETIAKFVKLNANSTLPVPTRLLPADRNESLDAFHRDTKIVYIYDGIHFSGNKDRIDITSGCIDITGSWEQEVRSVKTFGQCVLVYELFRCHTAIPGGPLKLISSNVEIQEDLRLVGYHAIVRSIQPCGSKKSAMSYQPSNNSTFNLMTMVFALIVGWLITN